MCCALIQTSVIIFPYLYGKFFDALSAYNIDYLRYLYYIAIFFAVYTAINLVAEYFAVKYRKKLSGDLSLELSRQILKLDSKTVVEKGEGYISSLIDQSVFCIANIFQSQHFTGLFSVAKAGFILVVLFRMNPATALIIAAWVGVYVLCFRHIASKGEEYYENTMESMARHSDMLIKRLRLRDLSRIYSKVRSSFQNDIKNTAAQLARDQTRDDRQFMVMMPLIPESAEPFVRAGALFLLSRQYFIDQISLGELVQAIAYIQLIAADIGAASGLADGYILAKSSANKIASFLDELDNSEPITLPVGEIDPAHFVELQDFSYRVQQRTRYSNPLHIELKRGQIYALTGQNAAGKSSLISILRGIEKDYRGTVRIANSNDENRTMHYFTQAVYRAEQIIEDYSIIENITMKSDIDNNLDEIIRILKIGYLLEREIADLQTLSGGEKRKIVLARFLFQLQVADWFVLDEVFVSLDVDYLSYVLPVVQRCISGKSGIVISHNPKVIETLCSSSQLNDLFTG